MNGLALVVMLGVTVSASPAISGRVLDASGAPVAGARVFLESGLGSPLVETQSDASGAYRFDNPRLGVAGLLAIADGYAFGGRTVTVAVADNLPDTNITLGAPQSLGGRVVDPKGKPIQGARITRALLLGAEKVGIPLAKLKALGIDEPVTDAEGRFTVDRLPQGGSVALKVGHPDFAQASPTALTVGDSEVRIAMNSGVLVRGQALSRDQHVPVANAQIILTRASEPYDTVVARTDPTGSFSVRLEPGVYLGQAATAEFRSPSRQKMTVSGEAPEVKVTLYVAGTGLIKGTVSDAAGAKPVDGAKLILEANGGVAAHVFTGPTGEFEMEAAEGENTVTLDSAPGYQPPERSVVRVTVAEGQTLTLPTFWVAPIPSYSVQVVDANMQPVAGAVVSLLRPAQFGWRVTGADGRTDLQFGALPPDGTVVGMAEHPTQPLGALFALTRANAKDAKVQLLPLGSVTGSAAAGNKRLEGAVVGAVFADPPFTDTVLLWQTLTREGGEFRWDSVVPMVGLKCVGKAGDKMGESATYTLEPSATKDIGRISISQGVGGKSLYGQTLRWAEGRLQAGQLPAKSVLRNSPAVVMYCGPEEAAAVAEGLGVAQQVFASRGIVFAVVVAGTYPSGNAAVPVLQGTRPGAATTYIVDADGKVVLEAYGMPPLRALQGLAAGAAR